MNRLAVQLSRFTEDAWRSARDRVLRWYDAVAEFVREIERESRVEPPQPANVEAPPVERVARVPENTCVYAIGDIHGRADLLRKLVGLIKDDAESLKDGVGVKVIFLGDYVDRGFQSKEVIDYLLSDSLNGFETVFLKGNHEAAFLEFLSDPAFGPDWAKFGGAETLSSYGVRPPRSKTFAEEWTEVRDQLNEVLPPEHRSFLVSLQVKESVGDYVFVHAGLRPGRPVEEQLEQDMLWIRDSFLNDKAEFDQVVVHGHTPIPKPHRDQRRIGIDTGAYLSGKLTAARFFGEEVRFIST